MTFADNPDQKPERINRRRLIAFLLALPVYFALFMFLPAGTWAWTTGWLFIGVFLGTLAVVALYLWRVNPEVVVARSGFHEGTKRWDQILMWFLFPAVFAIVPVAALDDGRFHWFPAPWWVCGVGYVLFLAGMGIVAWASREQVLRGHGAHSNGARSQGHRRRPLRRRASPRLRRHCILLRGRRLVPGFRVGVGSCGPCVSLADPADAVGRPDLTGRVARLQGVHGAGSAQVDSRRMVTECRKRMRRPTWPGREPLLKLLGKATKNASANDLMWEFFEKHPMK